MNDPIITLTTDFGESSPYVAAMKGVILSINPKVRLIDLSHQIPPQDLRFVAFFLCAALPYFPKEALHVIVVDPGVGTDRSLLYVELNGQRLLVPDNGCWTWLTIYATAPTRVIRLEERRFWRPAISNTFHGRDILAPVAGHLSLGIKPKELGPATETWVSLESPALKTGRNSVTGEVIFVDQFGNLITNIPSENLQCIPSEELILQVGKMKPRRLPYVRAYGDAKPGTLVALISSIGSLELAVSQGSAARRLKAHVGTSLRIKYNA